MFLSSHPDSIRSSDAKLMQRSSVAAADTTTSDCCSCCCGYSGVYCSRCRLCIVVVIVVVIAVLMLGAGFVAGWFAHQLQHPATVSAAQGDADVIAGATGKSNFLRLHPSPLVYLRFVLRLRPVRRLHGRCKLIMLSSRSPISFHTDRNCFMWKKNRQLRPDLRDKALKKFKNYKTILFVCRKSHSNIVLVAT